MKVTALKAHRKAIATFLVACSTLAIFPPSHAGIIDKLRGEDTPAGTSTFQRVAFVGRAEVKEVQGSAERLVGIDAWRPVQKGEKLAPGDLLRTRQGTVILKMKESGSFVKMTPQTVLRLLDMEKDWDKGALSGTEERRGFIVRSCRGKAFVRSSEGAEWQPIEVNSVLAAGSEIRTEIGTILDLYSTSRRRPVRVEGATLVKLHEGAFADRVLVKTSLVAASRP